MTEPVTPAQPQPSDLCLTAVSIIVAREDCTFLDALGDLLTTAATQGETIHDVAWQVLVHDSSDALAPCEARALIGG